MSIEAMKLALEALEDTKKLEHLQDYRLRKKAIEALRAAIQQAEQPATGDAAGYAAFKAKADELFGWVVGLGGYGDAVRALWDFACQQPATGEPAATKHEAMASALAQLRDAHRCNMAELRPTEVHRICFEALEVAKRTTHEPVAIGYINEMDELVKYPAPCIWMGQDCPRAKADRATHECYQRIYTHPAPSVPDDVRIAGQALANIAFNLAQNTGQKIEKRWADSMREAYKAWDAAMLAAK